MKTLIGFLSVIAVELLQLTYLHRTQPLAPAIEILNPLELKILKAKSPKLPKVLTVSWAVEAVARLGGYLELWSRWGSSIGFIWRWRRSCWVCWS